MDVESDVSEERAPALTVPFSFNDVGPDDAQVASGMLRQRERSANKVCISYFYFHYSQTVR